MPALFVVGCRPPGDSTAERDGPPNVIVILTDDQGYADVGAFGAEGFTTPNLDRLASEGMRLTSFYTPASVCTPTRAALLTGRYPVRVGLPHVVSPRSRIGLNPEEVTLPEVLKQHGYATAMVGKWHLGDHPEFLPPNHGFDRFFGLPYSNDMSPDPRNNPRERARRHPPLPLIEDTTIVEREPDQTLLVRRYTERAVEFIDTHREGPFFLYFAHHSPHVPLYASDAFDGKTARGRYGDVVEEIDWSVGELLRVLEEHDLRRNTLIFFTSDNGPWLVFGDHGGSAGPFREGKGTTFEGGHRVPAIANWPGRIPAGSTSEAVATIMDILPTATRLAGGRLPEGRILDGHDIWPILSGEPEAESPYEAFFYYAGRQLQAVRSGRWKLHVPHDYQSVTVPGRSGQLGATETRHIELSLFDLSADPGEERNVADDHPEIADSLLLLIERQRQELGDVLTGESSLR